MYRWHGLIHCSCELVEVRLLLAPLFLIEVLVRDPHRCVRLTCSLTVSSGFVWDHTSFRLYDEPQLALIPGITSMMLS